MSFRNVAIALAVVAAGVIALLATGVVGLRTPDDDSLDGSGPVDPEPVDEEIDRLESLGYAGAVEVRPEHRDKEGVTRRVEGAFEERGLGIGTPLGWGIDYHRAGGKRSMNEARLLDMRGEVVHRWEYRLKAKDVRHGWDIAKLGPDGLLYVVYDRNALIVLDWESRPQRVVRGRFHHDLALRGDGSVIVMDEQRRTLVDPVDGYEYDLLDQGFTLVSAQGEPVRSWWLHDALQGEAFYQEHLRRRLDRWRPARTRRGEPHQVADFQHANTVEILHDAVPGLWEAGDLMTMLREVDVIVVLSAEDGTLRWAWGQGVLDRAHDPSQIAGDRLLVFDNGWHRDASRVLEVLAPSGEIAWTYQGTAAEPFFSHKRGLAQRLADGNTVINSSQSARTFEVTPEGRIVWEYFSPDRLGKYRVPMRYVRLEGEALAAARARLAAATP